MIRCLASILIALILAGPAAASELPIFDAHVHYSRDAWDSFTPAEIARLLEKAGVPRALVSSSPDDGTLMLQRFDPQRFVAELRPYRGTVNSGNWFGDDATPKYLSRRLQAGDYTGIGEFHLFDQKHAESATVRAVVKLALARKLILHVHADERVIDSLFAQSADLRILWAHAGMSTPPDVVAAYLDRYPRLWVELSFREDEILAGPSLAGDWLGAFKRHPDRFVIGSDTYITPRWYEYTSIIADHRRWLAMLPDDVARQIAYGNAVRLFGHGGLSILGVGKN